MQTLIYQLHHRSIEDVRRETAELWARMAVKLNSKEQEIDAMTNNTVIEFLDRTLKHARDNARVSAEGAEMCEKAAREHRDAEEWTNRHIADLEAAIRALSSVTISIKVGG